MKQLIRDSIAEMDVSFEQLKSMVVFAEVANQGSFTAAAKKLNLTRAVVSYHVKKLESQLGMKLLNRTTRSISLTEAGKVYFDNCQVISQQAIAAQHTIENFKNEPQGLLKITCPVNVGLQLIVPALNQFRRLYPNIELDVKLTDEVVNIIQDGIDLAIRGAPLKDSGMQATHLATMATCLCASPEYLRKHGRPQHPTDLSSHHWVLYQLSSSTIELKQGNRSFSIQAKGAVSTNNAAARTAFVEGGQGLGRIPEYDAMPKISQGKLEQVLTDYTAPNINVYGVFPPGTSSAKKLRLLLDYLKEALRSPL
ncbi:LysR family transcriptional regulator [Vibrio sp. ZSDZ34]|uniref:LysR family transcriptional regulator n=1 Tax=Vibrio gelatinilyticus TaxID=2893468 RepID=A0A9X2AVK7_9VIBR|nr:LysR family transcriptional regulator [Vibrio gelatinilyticus]MCJ2376974.1 LysR family transcriptional regulator [Vibrio gelatinilyticus]